MKVNVMGLLRNGAMGLKRDDPATAFCLLDLANNLRLLMIGEDNLDAFKRVYVGADREPFDIDNLLPVPADD